MAAPIRAFSVLVAANAWLTGTVAVEMAMVAAMILVTDFMVVSPFIGTIR